MKKDGICGSNQYMFQKVRCRAYLRKASDGRCITVISAKDSEDGKAHYYYTDNREKKEEDAMREVPDEDWGGSDFIKTYYRRTEKEFSGIIIGMKMVVTKAELYCDVFYGPNGSEYDYVNKYPKEKIKAVVVAYGCNRTRLVAMDDFEIMEVVDG